MIDDIYSIHFIYSSSQKYIYIYCSSQKHVFLPFIHLWCINNGTNIATSVGDTGAAVHIVVSRFSE